MADLVVIKTEVEGEACNRNFTIGHNMFVASLSEWQSFAPYLKERDSYYEYYESPMDLYNIYKGAQIIEAEKAVLNFIEAYGENLHLTIIRGFVQKKKREGDLYDIIDRIALLPKVKQEIESHHRTEDKVYPQLGGFPEFTVPKRPQKCIMRIPILENSDSFIFEQWEIPYNVEQVEYCRRNNQQRFNNQQMFNIGIYEKTKRQIVNAEDFSLYVEFPGYALRVSICDNVVNIVNKITVRVEMVEPYDTPFTLSIFQKDEEFQRGQSLLNKITTMNSYQPRICTLSSFSHYVFNRDDFEQKEETILTNFFTSFEKSYTGISNPLSDYFLSKYVKPENKTDKCPHGCFLILTDIDSKDLYNLKGMDKNFLEYLSQTFRVVDIDFARELNDKECLMVGSDTYKSCYIRENGGNSEDFGRCINPEALQNNIPRHECQKDEDERCEVDDDVSLLYFVFSKDDNN